MHAADLSQGGGKTTKTAQEDVIQLTHKCSRLYTDVCIFLQLNKRTVCVVVLTCMFSQQNKHAVCLALWPL